MNENGTQIEMIALSFFAALSAGILGGRSG